MIHANSSVRMVTTYQSYNNTYSTLSPELSHLKLIYLYVLVCLFVFSLEAVFLSLFLLLSG